MAFGPNRAAPCYSSTAGELGGLLSVLTDRGRGRCFLAKGKDQLDLAVWTAELLGDVARGLTLVCQFVDLTVTGVDARLRSSGRNGGSVVRPLLLSRASTPVTVRSTNWQTR